MPSDEIWAAVDDQRLRVAAVLDDLTDEEWQSHHFAMAGPFETSLRT
jgi:hypothetical protein